MGHAFNKVQGGKLSMSEAKDQHLNHDGWLIFLCSNHLFYRYMVRIFSQELLMAATQVKISI